MKHEKLAENVLEFLGKCAKEIGKFEEDSFEVDMYNRCCNSEITSPIERILYIALKTIQHLNYIEDYGDNSVTFKDGDYFLLGLGIQPQKKMGKYRCDFEIFWASARYDENKKKIKTVLVECDSQKFHERTEIERRYEKARDRYFTKQGYKVFHYTGSEIVKRPLEIAKEILEFVTEQEDLTIDSNIGEE